jgi:hypothetical protein
VKSIFRKPNYCCKIFEQRRKCKRLSFVQAIFPDKNSQTCQYNKTVQAISANNHYEKKYIAELYNYIASVNMELFKGRYTYFLPKHCYPAMGLSLMTQTLSEMN